MKAIHLALGSLLFVTLCSSISTAQVQRTFVSGLGNDSNPCSRTAPCRTISHALMGTSAGGEVIALDSAGYGAFSITQSVSIIAPPGVYAGISVFSGDGIDINASGSDTVILRGLTVENQGSSGSGIVFTSGSKLNVEGCVINGFSSNAGLHLFASGAHVQVMDSVMRGNFIGIVPHPSSGTAIATIDHVRLEGNAVGLRAREGSQVTVSNSVAAGNDVSGLEAESDTSASVQMNVESTAVTGNGTNGIVAFAAGTGAIQVNVARCVISSNTTRGVLAESSSTGVATVRVSGSTVIGNGTGLGNNGSPAILLSRGDNTVEGNTTDTFGTIGSYTAK